FERQQLRLGDEAESQLLALKALDFAAINTAFDQLSPLGYAAAPAAVRSHHAGFAGRVGRHLARQRRGVGPSPSTRHAVTHRSPSTETFGHATFASAADDPAALAQAIRRTSQAPTATKTRDLHADPRLGGFVEGFALFSDHGNSNGNGAAYRAGLRGGQVGFDYRHGSRWTLGGSFAVGKGHVEAHPGGGRSDWLSVAGGPYAAYEGDAWFFDGGLSLGYDRFEHRRAIDALDVAAASDFHTWNAAVHGRIGTDLACGAWTLTPQVGLAFQHTHPGGVRERDAGPLGLNVSEQGSDSLRTRIGLEASAAFDVGGVVVAPEGFVGYEHEWLTDERTRASFLAGGDAFAIDAGDLHVRDSLLLGGGANVLLNPRQSLYLRYDGRLDADGETHSVTAGWSWRF
ncbi:MAG: autotransporter outer membrane beta-barrel domain-containing protein, partial [Phycisphaeraceae bacterium]